MWYDIVDMFLFLIMYNFETLLILSSSSVGHLVKIYETPFLTGSFQKCLFASCESENCPPNNTEHSV